MLGIVAEPCLQNRWLQSLQFRSTMECRYRSRRKSSTEFIKYHLKTSTEKTLSDELSNHSISLLLPKTVL